MNAEQLSEMLQSNRLSQTKLADQTGVLLDVNGLKVFSLNETGMHIVECLRAGVHSVDELCQSIIDEFEVERETARSDVEVFLEQLSGALEK